jgi:hypothetical protein
MPSANTACATTLTFAPEDSASATSIHAAMCTLITAQAKDSATWAAYAQWFLSEAVVESAAAALETQAETGAAAEPAGDSAPSVKKRKDACDTDEKHEGDEPVSIKVCSMDGSSVVARVPADSTILDVKTSITGTLALATTSTSIVLHFKGIEDPLADAALTRVVFANGEAPVLFMFRQEASFEIVTQLRGQLAALKTAQLSEAKAVHTRHNSEHRVQSALISGCLKDLRAQTDGKTCQICLKEGDSSQQAMIAVPVTSCHLLVIGDEYDPDYGQCSACALLVCRECSPNQCDRCSDGCNDEYFQERFCKACWLVKYHDDTGKCRCDGCKSKAGYSRVCRKDHCQDCGSNTGSCAPMWREGECY